MHSVDESNFPPLPPAAATFSVIAVAAGRANSTIPLSLMPSTPAAAAATAAGSAGNGQIFTEPSSPPVAISRPVGEPTGATAAHLRA